MLCKAMIIKSLINTINILLTHSHLPGTVVYVIPVGIRDQNVQLVYL